jgi:alanine racemase
VLYVTHVNVDLDAIAHNVEQARKLSPRAKVLVAVKADGYGHGAVAVSRHLAKLGLADWFGVATTPEGIELREAGITQPILKLSPCLTDDELDAAIAFEITPTVIDAASIAAVSAAVGRAGGKGFAVHMAVDTGMRRIGCSPADAAGLARTIGADPALKLQGLFTHFPISDQPAGDEFTAGQIVTLEGVAAQIQQDRAAAGLEPVELVHASNSAAVLGHPTDFGMVRPGIMAYGYYPDAQTPRPVELRPALSWKSQISYCKPVSAGETVGYGRTWTAPVDSWVATVPVGYGDGFSRLNSNRGRMLVGGVSYPIVGRVCMDQTMLDLGPVVAGQPAPAEVGDEVVIIGQQGSESIDADELAALMGTISYEVTCLINKRVVRYYSE